MGTITVNPTIDLLSDKQPTIFYLDDGAAVFNCIGNPNNVIAANIGSLAIDNQTGNVYTKTTNFVASGWTAVGGGGGGGTVALPLNSVQWNNAGAFGGDAGFLYNPTSSPNTLITQKNALHIGLNLKGIVNNDATIPLFKAESADGTASVCIDPTGDQFSADCNNMLLVQNSSNARNANFGVFDRVTTGQAFATVNGSAGDGILLLANGSATSNASLLQKPRAVILQGSANGQMYIMASDPGGIINFVTGGTAPANVRCTFSASGEASLQSGARTFATVTPYFQILTPADTALTTLTEAIGAQFGGNASQATVIRQHATGNITTQRENLFVAPTYSFVAASTITTSATVAITGAPIAGTNATLTNRYGLLVQDGSGNVGFVVTNTGTPGAPRTTESEVFGVGASVTGLRSIAIGANASCSGSQSIVIGRAAATTLGGNLDGVLIGAESSTTGSTSIIIGKGLVLTNFDNSILIGSNSAATSSISGAIGLGSGVSILAGNQFVAGSGGLPINNVYFGKGVNNASPTAYTINGTGGNGTDIGGANINIATGYGTGAGNPGTIAFLFARPSGSSSTLNTFSDEVFYQYSTDTITHQVNLKSSTTIDVPATTIVHSWVVNTHASRTTRMVLNALDFGGTREGLRIQSSGSAPMIGFLGAAAAIRQTGGALTAAATYGANEQSMLNKVYTCLQTFGLLT